MFFQAKFPAAEVVFVLDNSSGHRKYAADALNAASMNKGPGGVRGGVDQAFRDGWFLDAAGVRQVQR